jgi:hypothetical protein
MRSDEVQKLQREGDGAAPQTDQNSPAWSTSGVRVLNPENRVPLSFIIDDSTCLVNLNKFAIPQFAAGWGSWERFQQPWREWPNEIPDSFVRKFGEWCAEQGVKGKYSVVPYPACVGRIDRVLPGWTAQELDDSLELVRTLMMPNWDIHPEMITHTCVLDLKTGQPYPERSLRYQENWEWTVGRSTDELAAYMQYALQIMKNAGLPCEGITTPGGFAGKVLKELSEATLQACRDVFQTDVPHYFRHLYSQGEQSVAPRVEQVSGLDGPDPQCVVSIIGCTGDWTGGWDCSSRGDADLFITPDLQAGRLVEVIERGEPAILVCHWTGIYFNGEEVGFHVFQEVVRRLNDRYNHLIWMKLSEIARYWAARECTQIERSDNQITLKAPFATSRFTVEIRALPGQEIKTVSQMRNTEAESLTEVQDAAKFISGTWRRSPEGAMVCLDLPRGETRLQAA